MWVNYKVSGSDLKSIEVFRVGFMDITGVRFPFSLRKAQRFSAPSSGAGTWEGLKNACWVDVETPGSCLKK